MWHFHDSIFSIVKPRNFLFVPLVISLFSNLMFELTFWPFFVQNCKLVVLLKFKNSKLFLNHSFTLVKTLFISKFYRTGNGNYEIGIISI